MIQHDLRAPLAGIVNTLEVLKEEQHKAEADPKFVEEINRLLENQASSLLRHLQMFRFLPEPEGDEFLANPSELVNSVSDLHNSAGRTLNVTCPHAEEYKILFPSSVLWLIFNEPVTNAFRHYNGEVDEVKVALNWQISESRFLCTIEDNGPGITSDLSVGYASRYMLLHGPSARQRIRERTGLVCAGDGLFYLDRVIEISGGLLLFRRSPTLGGTEVRIEIPLIGYWKNDELVRFKGEPNHECK